MALQNIVILYNTSFYFKYYSYEWDDLLNLLIDIEYKNDNFNSLKKLLKQFIHIFTFLYQTTKNKQ